jgi:hypothetical protein
MGARVVVERGLDSDGSFVRSGEIEAVGGSEKDRVNADRRARTGRQGTSK